MDQSEVLRDGLARDIGRARKGHKHQLELTTNLQGLVVYRRATRAVVDRRLVSDRACGGADRACGAAGCS